MKYYILGLVLCMSTFSVYAIKEPDSYMKRKVQIYSEGDYGLDLDWMQNNSNISPYLTTIDKKGFTYIAGQFGAKGGTFNNGETIISNHANLTGWGGWFVVKCNSTGDQIWLDKIEVDGNYFGKLSQIYTSNDELLLIGSGASEQETYNLYINNQKKFTIKNARPFILKLDNQTGEYVNHVILDNGGKSDPESIGGNIYKIAEDGSIFLMSYIGEKFASMDDEKLKTNTRTHGGADVYIAKINPDFTLAWDFAFGGDMHDVPWAPEMYSQEYYFSPLPEDGNLLNWMVLKDDTLIVKMSYFSDEVDIDPSENEEILKMKWMNEAVIARYYVGGDSPVLLDYKKNYTERLPHDVYLAENGQLYTLDMKRVENSVAFDDWKRYYKSLNNDLSLVEENGYQYDLLNNDATFFEFYNSFTNSHLYIDSLSNMYISLYAVNDSVSAILTDSIKMYCDGYTNIEHGVTAGLVKYDNNNNLKWGIILPISHFAHKYTIDNKGGIYITGYASGYLSKDTIDISTNENDQILLINPDGMLLRYVETYRIKSAPSEHGKIITPEKLVRWGGSAEVSVVPEAGYVEDEVTTSRGENLTKNAEGKYVVENVTDVVTVSATFKKSSAVDETYSDRVKIYPNPVESSLSIECDEKLTQATIYDAQGKEVLSISNISKEISVNHLPAGLYTLKIKMGEATAVKQFIKK